MTMSPRILVPVSLLIVLAGMMYMNQGASKSPTSASGSQDKDTTSVQTLEKVLAFRASDIASLPLHDSLLLTLLPDPLPGFQLKDARGSTFRGKKSAYAEATKAYTNARGDVLSISLSDCIGDSSALRHAYWTVETQSPSGQLSIKTPERFLDHPSGFFAMIRSLPESPAKTLEAGLCYRFLIVISTSRTEDSALLQTAFDSLDWDSIAKQCGNTAPSR